MRIRHWATVVLFCTTWFLLLFRLNDVAPGLQHDQVFSAIDAQQLVDGRFTIYFPANFGRGPAFMYTAAAVFKLTQGHWVWGLRFTAVLWAMLGQALTVVFARQYLRPGAALFAAALMGGSFWFLLAGRLGVESISLMPAALACFYFIARGLSRGSLRMFALAGVMGGFANYTYLASRTLYALPVLMVGVQVVYMVLGRRQGQADLHQKRLLGLLVTLALMLLVSSPLLLYLRAHPDLADNRIQELSGPVLAAARGEFAPLLRNALDTLRSLGWGGSSALPYHYSVPGRAALQPVWVVLLLVGILLTTVRLADAREALLLVALMLGLGPNLLTGGDALAMRAIYALPLLFILVARGADACWSAAVRWLGRKRSSPGHYAAPVRLLSTALAAGLLIWHWADGADSYFNRWASGEQTLRIYNADFRLAARYVDERVGDDEVFIGTDRDFALDSETYHWYEPTRQDVNWYRLPGNPPVPSSLAATYLGPTTADVPPVLRYFIAAGAASDELDDPHGQPLLWRVRVTQDLLGTVEQQANLQWLDAPLEYEETLQLTGVGWKEDSSGSHLLTRWNALGLWPRATEPGMPLLEPKLSLSLVDDTGFTWVHQDTRLNLPVHNMLAGQSLLEITSFALPSDMPPGDYDVRIVLYDDQAGPLKMRRDGPLFATAPVVATLTVPSRPAASAPTPPYAASSPADSSLRALGRWEPLESLLAEAVTYVHVTWQAQQDISTAELTFRITGWDQNNQVLWTQTGPAELALPRTWEAGRAFRLAHPLQPTGAPEGQTPVRVSICAEVAGVSVGCADLADAAVINLPVTLALDPLPAHGVDARWGDTLSLVGYNLEDDDRTLTLFWQAGAAPDAPLKRFVHVVDEADRIVAQTDAPLEKAGLPVTYWRTGEFVLDQVRLTLPSSAGVRRICLGVYDADSEVRLPVSAGDGQPLPDNRFCLP